MKRINYKIVIHIISILCMINGIFLLLTSLLAAYFNEPLNPFILGGIVSSIIGVIVFILTKNKKPNINKREGFLIVSTGWIIMALIGCIPYYICGSFPDFVSAFFESISGYTTTGASVITDIENLPKSILFWRSLTQWIGGMGIIVLTVAILPVLGVGGMQLFVAESPGPSAEKLTPRITDTAKRLWYIYLGFTAIIMITLKLLGMNWFDAINHALTTISTGGFSTKNNSIAFFTNPLIHYALSFFMLLAGLNFVILYHFLKRNFKKIWRNEEMKIYLLFVVLCIFCMTFFLHTGDFLSLSASFRIATFNVISIITTTGFANADYTIWSPFIKMAFFMLMFSGACAASTSGGIKIVRHIIIFKNSILELKRQIHPSAIIPVRFNNRAVSSSITRQILSFGILYFFVLILGVLTISLLGLNFETALGAVASCLGNVGPGIGDVGPVDNYAFIPSSGKLLLSFFMLLGRLELFTILVLFSHAFWYKN